MLRITAWSWRSTVLYSCRLILRQSFPLHYLLPKIIADCAKLCLYHLLKISVHCHVAPKVSMNFFLPLLFLLRSIHKAFLSFIGLYHLLYEMSFKSMWCFCFLICFFKRGYFLKPSKNLKPENESTLFSLPLSCLLLFKHIKPQTKQRMKMRERVNSEPDPVFSAQSSKRQCWKLLQFTSWKYSDSMQLVNIKYMLLWIKS